MAGRVMILAGTLVMAAAAAAASPAAGDPLLAELQRCAPVSYDAALDCLDHALPAADKAVLARPEGPIGLRFGLGMWIGNHWVRPSGGPLYPAMRAVGFTEPADMSEAVLDGLAARDRGQPLDLAARASEARQNRETALRQAVKDGPPGSIYCAFPSDAEARSSEAATDAAMQACSDALRKQAPASEARR